MKQPCFCRAALYIKKNKNKRRYFHRERNDIIKELTHLSLFTGIGGLDMAAEAAGLKTVGQCEWADYPRQLLKRRWPNVPKWKDIITLSKEDFFDKTKLTTVDVISGGFPCQPFSHAGKRRGTEDDRFLWPEMLRVITELQPTWVIGENVTGIINLALDQVLSDLESRGYSTTALTIPASAIDAPHRRERVAIIGYNPHKHQNRQYNARISVADSSYCGNLWRQQLSEKTEKAPKSRNYRHSGIHGTIQKKWWPSEPGVGRVAHGIPHRLDRLKCLGNAVVAKQFYPIFSTIASIEIAMNS